MDKEYEYLLAELNILVLLNLGNIKVLVNINMLMEIFLKDNGIRAIKKAKEYLNI